MTTAELPSVGYDIRAEPLPVQPKATRLQSLDIFRGITIAGMLEPRHGQVRRIINAVVAFHKSQKIEPFLEELAEHLLDELLTVARNVGPDGVDVIDIGGGGEKTWDYGRTINPVTIRAFFQSLSPAP